jgi:hypothetical protein
MSRQTTRYLCLVVIFAVSGYLIWRGDDSHIGTTPAHYVGYLIAALGVAGLLGVNIWWGGPLDKRRDADPAGNIPRAGLIVMAIAVVAGSISSVILFVPIEGADDVKIGKYRITANFPCRPKRHMQVVGKTDMGDEVTQTMLVCSQGDVTYSVSAMEYPEQAIKSMPADAWLDRSLDGLRSEPQYTLKSSTRQVHQTFPAILTHFMDSREPPIDLARLFVMTDAGMIAIGASWPSGSPEPSRATSFTRSLSIGEK